MQQLLPCLRLVTDADARIRPVTQFKVKMVTADDEQTTDIITSGDVEETTRFCRVRCHRDIETTLTVFSQV